jgi:hypothetical protein
MPVPLDEYPVHQVPLSMRYMDTSDRNAYDRSYFNAHDRTGEIFFVSGLGVYPNLGVIDAYATIARGKRQSTLRLSDALGENRMNQRVGPYSIEVTEPLERIHLSCEENEQGISFDLNWNGSFAAVEEPRHLMRQAGRIILDASRFAQVGTWSGTITIDDETFDVDEDRWLGTRDRSWGIRPIGEAEPPGRSASEPDERFGFWWTYVPLRFDDFELLVIAQEDGEGGRTMNEALRVWGDSKGARHEQLGWPDFDISYRPDSRIPTGASILLQRGSNTVKVDIETLGFVALNSGPGYGGDPDWSHGTWRGRGFAERVDVDLDDPAVFGRIPFGVIDHVARASCDGAEGWGMFEHASFGRHMPSGFEGWDSVAH